MRALGPALVLAALALSGCGKDAVIDSGIEGVAMTGPTCPNLRDPPEPECDDKPYEGDLVVATPDGGKVLKKFRTNAHGEFRVAIGPGEYSIRNDPASDNFPYCSSQGTIIVEAGRFTRADVSCDTGIR